ncbi:MAG: hypothetical protein R3E89_11775 [Thiolinea sp.]
MEPLLHGGEQWQAHQPATAGQNLRAGSAAGCAGGSTAGQCSASKSSRPRIARHKSWILDEPTGVLTLQEADDPFRILRTLKADGVTILLITHTCEIMAITDKVSVMRHGRMVAERITAETSMPELPELMVGRKVRQQVDRQEQEAGRPLLQVTGLSVKRDASGIQRVKNVSLQVHAGGNCRHCRGIR